LGQLVNADLPSAVSRAGASGDAQPILEVAWSVGRKVAWARAWARVVRATDVPARFNPLREELSRTLEPTVKKLTAFAPDLLATLDRQRGSATPVVPKLTLTIENQEALRQAVKTAMS
jgi:hypothetical protein